MTKCLNILSRGNIWIPIFIVKDYRNVFSKIILVVMIFLLCFQYDMMGRNQTAVREEMIRLANYLDSVSSAFCQVGI